MASQNGFNELERAVLDWLKDRYNDRQLSAQIDAAVFREREWTGAGCYTDLEVPRWLPPIDMEKLGIRWPIDGPDLKSDDIDLGGGVLFWGTDGFINCIEMYAYGGYFNEGIKKFELIT